MLVALLFAHSLGYAADLKMMGRPCLRICTMKGIHSKGGICSKPLACIYVEYLQIIQNINDLIITKI